MAAPTTPQTDAATTRLGRRHRSGRRDGATASCARATATASVNTANATARRRGRTIRRRSSGEPGEPADGGDRGGGAVKREDVRARRDAVRDVVSYLREDDATGDDGVREDGESRDAERDVRVRARTASAAPSAATAISAAANAVAFDALAPIAPTVHPRSRSDATNRRVSSGDASANASTRSNAGIARGRERPRTRTRARAEGPRGDTSRASSPPTRASPPPRERRARARETRIAPRPTSEGRGTIPNLKGSNPPTVRTRPSDRIRDRVPVSVSARDRFPRLRSTRRRRNNARPRRRTRRASRSTRRASRRPRRTWRRRRPATPYTRETPTLRPRAFARDSPSRVASNPRVGVARVRTIREAARGSRCATPSRPPRSSRVRPTATRARRR